MSKNSTLSDELVNARYEYRVWGKYRKACRKLATMASEVSCEVVEDCYLLGDDQDWNAKVRDSTLKLKQRVSHKRGFEQWSSNWHKEADSTPSPFDEVFEDLSLDRPQQGKRYDLNRAVAEMDDDSGTRALFVTKHRRRYRIGSMKAEVTKIDVHGSENRLHTVAIQGDNVKELVALLRKVGLHGLPNVAMHVALEDEENVS